MILFMNLEMLRQVLDAVTQQSDLHFRRTGIGIVRFKFFNDFVFFLSLLCHNYPPNRLFREMLVVPGFISSGYISKWHS